MSDQDIIALYWQREERAICATAEKYGAYCHRISYNILHSDPDAEECVNDTWMKAWDTIPPQRPDRLSAFLGRIVRNLSLNRYKQHHAKKRGGGQTELVLSELEECIPGAIGVEQILEGKLLNRILDDCLASLPEQKRNIFVLRYWYLSSIKQIAGNYGMSQSKITSMLHRMRLELKGILEKEGIWV